MSTRFDMVQLDTIFTSRAHGTQRLEGTDPRRVGRMVKTWDIRKVGTITVSQRADGSHFCIDGAHRSAAARELGITELPAIVHAGLTREQEAAMFSGLNDFARPSAISRFMARVDAGERAANDIKRTVESHGWFIGTSSLAHVAAVDALDNIYRNGAGTQPEGDNQPLLDATLALVTAAWGHDPDATNGSIIKGVAQLFGRFGADVDTKVLVSQMRQTTPGAIYRKAKAVQDLQGGTVPAAVAKILVGLHNTRKRTHKLPEWVWVR